jgi:hypothetical protein
MDVLVCWVLSGGAYAWYSAQPTRVLLQASRSSTNTVQVIVTLTVTVTPVPTSRLLEVTATKKSLGPPPTGLASHPQ